MFRTLACNLSASLLFAAGLAACSTPATGGAAAAAPDAFTLSDIAYHFDVAKTPPGEDAKTAQDPDVLTASSLDADSPEDAATAVPDGLDSAACAAGSVLGVVCAPTAGANVAFADVTLDVTPDCGGAAFHAATKADAKGGYTFTNVPPGSAQIGFAKGSFKGSTPVTIQAGKQLNLTTQDAKRCLKSTSVKIAVVLGDADHIEKLLDDLGFAYDSFESGTSTTVDTSAAQKLLMDPVKLGSYDVLFANCGTTLEKLVTDNPGVVANIQAFVNAGHSLYASDWAWDLVEWSFPDAIQFWGVEKSFVKGTKGPSTTDGPRQGPGPTMTQKKAGTPAVQFAGSLVDAGLNAALGKASTTIYEDLGTWVVMKAAGAGTNVEIEAAVKSAQGDWGTVPLVVTFTAGKGHVVYTSFHNIAQADAGGSVADIKAILTYLVFSL